ncbi:MAG: hypothetical protein UX72_C0014G0003 [Parcubacteria group bacterium GW2011_GWA2_47_10]|nr:MAG: hypothetical protein UX72_C0014G0003 [Parcubacteria group bacterium GW2011_GWA2_47_10]
MWGLLLAVPGGARAEGSTLYISPGAGSFIIGSTFDVSILLNTGDVSANTIIAELQFPADKIQLVNPSVGRSIIQIWVTQPSFSNKEGKIFFAGGIPSPGIKTSQGVVITMTFRVISQGTGEISFLQKSAVHADDGRGTDILKHTSNAQYSFSMPPPAGVEVSSPTHPDQTRWYKDPNPTLTWAKVPDVTGFSYAIDHDPGGSPDTTVDSAQSQVSFSNLESGIWYFHLRAEANNVWGGLSHYILQIDTAPPAEFGVNVSPEGRTTVRNPIIRFFTTDSASGFDHFELKIVILKANLTEETPFFFEVTSPYQITPLDPGKYKAIVRAFDRAGNWRDEEVDIHIVNSYLDVFSPEGVDFIFFTISWPVFLVILFILVFIFLIATVRIWWKHHPHMAEHARGDFDTARESFKKALPMRFGKVTGKIPHSLSEYPVSNTESSSSSEEPAQRNFGHSLRFVSSPAARHSEEYAVEKTPVEEKPSSSLPRVSPPDPLPQAPSDPIAHMSAPAQITYPAPLSRPVPNPTSEAPSGRVSSFTLEEPKKASPGFFDFFSFRRREKPEPLAFEIQKQNEESLPKPEKKRALVPEPKPMADILPPEMEDFELENQPKTEEDERHFLETPERVEFEIPDREELESLKTGEREVAFESPDSGFEKKEDHYDIPQMRFSNIGKRVEPQKPPPVRKESRQADRRREASSDPPLPIPGRSFEVVDIIPQMGGRDALYVTPEEETHFSGYPVRPVDVIQHEPDGEVVSPVKEKTSPSLSGELEYPKPAITEPKEDIGHDITIGPEEIRLHSLYAWLLRKRNSGGDATRNLLLFIFSASLLFGITTALAHATAAPAEPVISISPGVFYPSEEIFYVEGKGEPGSAVTLILQKTGAPSVTFDIPVNSRGEWSLGKNVPLGEGVWELRVRTNDPNGETSEWSPPKTIHSAIFGFSLFGIAIRYQVAGNFLLIIFVLILFIFFYSLSKAKKIARLIREAKKREKRQAEREKAFFREIHAAHRSVAEGIRYLKQDVAWEIEALKDASAKHPVGRHEIEKRENTIRGLFMLEEELEERMKKMDGRIFSP